MEYEKYVLPKFVTNENLYCSVTAENMQGVIANLQEDDNPVIIEIKIK
jgi:hypothetical protein